MDILGTYLYPSADKILMSGQSQITVSFFNAYAVNGCVDSPESKDIGTVYFPVIKFFFSRIAEQIARKLVYVITESNFVFYAVDTGLLIL